VQVDAPRLVIAGGVAANKSLRSLLAKLAADKGIDVFLPQPQHCTDNAAMIAYAAFQNVRSAVSVSDDWDARPRWSLADLSAH